MTNARNLPGIISLLAIAACAGSPASDPTGSAKRNVAPLPTTIALAPGTSVEVERANLRIHFDSVVADSRCPSDVVCVWAGEATASLSVGYLSGEMLLRLVTLSTTPGKDTATVLGTPLKLVSVTPATSSKTQIPKSAYRIGILVGAAK